MDLAVFTHKPHNLISLFERGLGSRRRTTHLGKNMFYIVKHHVDGKYLSIWLDAWVADVRKAAVFTLKSNAERAIRHGWKGACMVERIHRLPDRIPESAVSRQQAKGTTQSRQFNSASRSVAQSPK